MKAHLQSKINTSITNDVSDVCIHSRTRTYTDVWRGILLLKLGYKTICVVKSHFALKISILLLCEDWKIIYEHMHSGYP